MDEKFEEIIQAAIIKANWVKCDAEEYRHQLRSWIETIQISIQASEECSR
jgi:hypothetical protein